MRASRRFGGTPVIVIDRRNMLARVG